MDMKNETKELLKITRNVLRTAIRIKLLDVSCFAEEMIRKNDYSDKLIVMRTQQYVLCKQGARMCDKALSIIRNHEQEGL